MFLPLAQRAHHQPDEPALWGDGEVVTWSEAANVVLGLGHHLRGRDLGAGRRVAVLARNRPATVLAHAAALVGEVASVPVGFHLTPDEVGHQLDEADAGLLLVDGWTEDVGRAAAASRPGVVVVRLPDRGTSHPDLDALLGPPEVPSPRTVVRPNLLFTSGTTGRPKAVELPPGTMGSARHLGSFLERLSEHRMVGRGPHLVAGPLYHNGPLTAVRLLLAGTPIVVPGRFDAEVFLDLVARHRVASSVMVPTHFVRLLALPEATRREADTSSLEVVVHTGGACPVGVKQAMLAWWGPVLYESYGGTESGTVCSIGPREWSSHPGSVGRPVPPFEAVVVDEDGRQVPPGTDGRLYFRDLTGRGIRFEGDEEKTRAAHLRPGVFTLGEIGHVDADGFVYITDRWSDMVVSGGVNIYPAEVERVLGGHPEVIDVACYGVPDPEMGERIHAAVQLVPGAAVGAEGLIDWSRRTLAGYKVPRRVHVVAEMDRNAMGKVDKRALRADLEQQEDVVS